MHAVDTNVVVRYLVGDDPAQAKRARTAILSHGAWVSTTVLLETEWVLRGVYRFSAERVIASLRLFAGLPEVVLEAPQAALRAFDLAERGLDLADAMHLSAASGCEGFMSFDKRLVRAAKPLVRQQMLQL